MGKEYSDYLKFIGDALELAKASPRYFSRFSNRIYCNYQKLAIYVLMQKFKMITRGIVIILKASSDMRMHLGLYYKTKISIKIKNYLRGNERVSLSC